MVPQIDFDALNLHHLLIIHYEELCQFPKETQLCCVKLMYFTIRQRPRHTGQLNQEAAELFNIEEPV